MTEAKNVSFKLHTLSEKNQEKVRRYLKQQNNIQKTIEFQMLYFQERFGDVDIMDLEVQRILFSDFDGSIKNAESKVVKKEKIEQSIENELSAKKSGKLADNVNSDDF